MLSSVKKNYFKLFCLYIYAFFIISCDNIQNVKSSDLDFNQFMVMNGLEEGLQEQSFVFSVAKIIEDFKNNNVTQCGNDFLKFLRGVRWRQPWALNMLDASGQESEGYLFPNTGWLGWKSQCENINKQNYKKYTKRKNKEKHAPFKLKYVSALFSHYNPIQIQFRMVINEHLQLGLCVPKSCTNKELFNLLHQLIQTKKLSFLQTYPVNLTLTQIKVPSFQNAKLLQFPTALITLIILFFVFCLTVVGSYYDVCRQRKFEEQKGEYNNKDKDNNTNNNKDAVLLRLLLCFSFPANLKSMFNTDIKSEKSLAAIHGFKAVMMFVIMIVHKPIVTIGVFDSFSSINRMLCMWYANVFKKSHYSVDTYFCIGGFLISYLFCNLHFGKKLTIKKSVNMLCDMLGHRLIRMLPVYLIMILIGTTLWHVVENSYPLFELFFMPNKVCPNFWWRNVLFISTWYNEWNEQCLQWSWYLSDDMQFYVLNCILLVTALRYLYFVESILKLIIIYSVGKSIWVIYNLEYVATIDSIRFIPEIYYAPYLRMAPYFIGVLTGIYFHKWKGKIPLNKRNLRFGWVIFCIIGLYLIQSLQDANKASLFYSAFNVGTGRALWALCTSWLLVCCLSGKAGIAGVFFEFSGWIPISRASFSIYLTNMMVVYAYVYTGETFEHPAISKEYLGIPGNIATCCIVGVIGSLLLESPIIGIVKILTKKTPKEIIKKTEVLKENEKFENVKQEIISEYKLRTTGFKH